MSLKRIYTTILAVPLMAACAAQPALRQEPGTSLEQIAQSTAAEPENQYAAQTAAAGDAPDHTAYIEEDSPKNPCPQHFSDVTCKKAKEAMKIVCEQKTSTEFLLESMIKFYHKGVDAGEDPGEVALSIQKEIVTLPSDPMFMKLCAEDQAGMAYRAGQALVGFKEYLNDL